MVQTCSRFRADGSACENVTDHADGWCRAPECPGYRRASVSVAPEVGNHGPRGTKKHIEQTAHVPLGQIDLEDVADVRVSLKAVESFRFHHGGGAREAETELRLMLEDFLLKSSRRISPQGFLALARDGYEIVLNPERSVVTAYSTIHRERTWEQVKAGVRSRFAGSSTRSAGSWGRQKVGEAPEPGEPVDVDGFGAAFDADRVHLTGRVRTSFAKVEGLVRATDEDLDVALRAAAGQAGTSGVVSRRADGLFEVTDVSGRVWLVSPDALALVGVKRLPAVAVGIVDGGDVSGDGSGR